MQIMDSIRAVLSRGCGKDLKKVLRSKRLSTLEAANKSLHSRHPIGTDTGTALRAGHQQFGLLINTECEETALVKAKNVSPRFGCGMELRPLIQLTGEHLVKAADECLTPTMKSMAAQWKSKNAEEQIALCSALYEMLISGSQNKNPDKEMNFGTLQQSVYLRMESNSYDDAKVLPREYGPWNPKSCKANCQGKSQMLAAFARRAGAQIITAHPLIHSGSVMNQMRDYVNQKIHDDMMARGITEIDSSFRESLMAYMLDSYSRRHDDNFHVCVALEISDGRWVLIDPHALNFGVFPANWNVSHIAQQLNRYREVLPGLHIFGNDQGLHRQLMEEVNRNVTDLLAHSKNLEKLLDPAENPIDLVNRFMASDELDFLMARISDWEQEQLQSLRTSPQLRELTAFTTVLGADPFEMMGMMLGTNEKEFMTQRKHTMYTAYHSIAMNDYRNQWTDNGTLLHPACEFSNVEYTLAMAAINSLAGTHSTEVNRFFLDYSFDQVSLSNALMEALSFGTKRAKDEEVGLAAYATLKALPMAHPISQWRMSQMRKEKP